MDEIKKKIEELIALNQKSEDFNYRMIDVRMKKQDKLIEELKKLAKNNETLLGRVISLAIADGDAKYVITNVGQKFVKLQWLDYCDGYSDWYLGRGTSNLDINQAREHIELEDMFDI